jgi:hypothetical protein
VRRIDPRPAVVHEVKISDPSLFFTCRSNHHLLFSSTLI